MKKKNKEFKLKLMLINLKLRNLKKNQIEQKKN